MIRLNISLFAFTTTLIAFLPKAAAQTCNATNLCPSTAPCCSEYGYCGTDSYCLGGCEPLCKPTIAIYGGDVADRMQTPTKSLHAGQILSVLPSRPTSLTLTGFSRMYLCTTVMPQRTIGLVSTMENVCFRLC